MASPSVSAVPQSGFDIDYLAEVDIGKAAVHRRLVGPSRTANLDVEGGHASSYFCSVPDSWAAIGPQ